MGMIYCTYQKSLKTIIIKCFWVKDLDPQVRLAVAFDIFHFLLGNILNFSYYSRFPLIYQLSGEAYCGLLPQLLPQHPGQTFLLIFFHVLPIQKLLENQMSVFLLFCGVVSVIQSLFNNCYLIILLNCWMSLDYYE